MIGFSIMTWFIAVIMIGLSISLLKGNYTLVHGNVFDRTKDKAGYAKKLGKPVLLLAVGIAISGVLAIALPQEYAMTIVIIFLLLVVAVTIGLFYRVDKYFRKSLLE
jgi:hypothetical protein